MTSSLSKPEFYLWEDKTSNFLIGLLYELKEIVYVNTVA